MHVVFEHRLERVPTLVAQFREALGIKSCHILDYGGVSQPLPESSRDQVVKHSLQSTAKFTLVERRETIHRMITVQREVLRDEWISRDVSSMSIIVDEVVELVDLFSD